MAANYRVGIGHDTHRLVSGRSLVLGGVTIPHDKGLDGWSDADAVIHATIDAILGAAGMGDIGKVFPPGTTEYKGISSLKLLESVSSVIRKGEWVVSNIDVSIVAERPRLSGFTKEMSERMSRVLEITPGQVNVKAGTNEGMGFTGREEGIEVLAVALLQKADNPIPDTEES